MNRTARLSAAACALAVTAPVLAATPADAAAAKPPRLPKGTITAKVVKIVSGDTVDVRYQGGIRRVRLLGVDTPDPGRCWSREATARTAALLKAGRGVYLLRDKRLTDSSGRYLYYAWTPSGTFVNRNLVRYGFGRVVSVKPNVRYLPALRSDQAKAKQERLRIWSGRCGPLGRAGTGGTGGTGGSGASGGGSAKGSGGSGKASGGSGKASSGTGGGGSGTGRGTGGGGTDPRFRTCAEANAAGYGPYVRGRDPEYSWYQDRDGDGVVCER